LTKSGPSLRPTSVNLIFHLTFWALLPLNRFFFLFLSNIKEKKRERKREKIEKDRTKERKKEEEEQIDEEWTFATAHKRKFDLSFNLLGSTPVKQVLFFFSFLI
jgi:hypothetical protein